jgi:hypothetical protein
MSAKLEPIIAHEGYAGAFILPLIERRQSAWWRRGLPPQDHDKRITSVQKKRQERRGNVSVSIERSTFLFP